MSTRSWSSKAAATATLAVLATWTGAILAQAPPSGAARTGVDPVQRKIVGVKIYEPASDTAALFHEWHRLGVNTAFISRDLAESGTFIPAARRAGIRTLVVTPVFYNPGYLAEHPEAWAITGRGERAKQDWVEFVCPSREDYRQQRARAALSLLQTAGPDGLSLDFIRHFVFWEMLRPDARIDPLDTTCFCPHCLARFQEDTRVRIPVASAGSAPDAARWLFAHGPEAWIRWRAELITSWVRDVAREAVRVAPYSMVGVHVVPWGRLDYDDGLMRVAGQDVEALAPLVDYLSPMCYAHMLYREPGWIARVTRELAERVSTSVHPSIQVKEAYRSEVLPDAVFEAALEAALAPPSDGVSFWSWPPLAEQESKRDILARRTR
jgi:hypothetical protein